MDSKQKEQQQWHELYEKWSWVASQFFDEAVKDFNEVKDANNKRAYFCLPPKIEEHLRRVWRAILADEFSSIKFSKLIEKIENGKNVRPPMEIEFISALRQEIDLFFYEGFSPAQVLKDSDNRDELKRNWYDFFYWGHDKRLAASLGKVSKVLDRKEVKNSLDVLLWQGWERKEVEEIYLERTKGFGSVLRWLRYDVLGEKDLPIDTIYGRPDFYGENSIIRLSLERWFSDALKEFMKGKKSWILKISPTANRDLRNILDDLWKVNFQICFLIEKLAAAGYKATVQDGRFSFSVNYNYEKLDMIEGERDMPFLRKYARREWEIQKELRREGRVYYFFWTRRFPWFWGKSYSDELATTVRDYSEKEIRNEKEFHLSLISVNVMEQKLKAGGVTAEDVKKNEERKTSMEKELVFYRDVLARFEENWKDVQEMVAHDLGGWRYYVKQFTKWALPWLVALVVIANLFKKQIIDFFK